MKCKHCNGEMIVDNTKILTSYPPQQIYTCPRCGNIEIEYVTTTVPYDLGFGPIIVDERNSPLVTGKYQTETHLDKEKRIRADERKKVVEEIKTLCEKEKEENDLAWLGFKKLNRILDQVEKGESNED